MPCCNITCISLQLSYNTYSCVETNDLYGVGTLHYKDPELTALLTRVGAQLVLQIHDKLVCEVSREHVVEFIREAVAALSHSPCPGFAVPIMLGPKHGTRFRALTWRDAKAIASLRPPRSALARPGRPRLLPWWPAGCHI